MTKKKKFNWNIVLLIGVVIYVISPIDFIPDIIPILGWIDDIIVIFVGVSMFISTMKDKKKRIAKLLK